MNAVNVAKLIANKSHKFPFDFVLRYAYKFNGSANPKSMTAKAIWVRVKFAVVITKNK